MNKVLSAQFLLIYVLTLTSAQHNVEFQFSRIALQMAESSGRRNIRQNWMIVPHMYEGDEVRVGFCINRSTIIKVNNITYSNDGAVKTITVVHGMTELGRFNTHSDSDWGRLWDRPVTSGLIGQSGMLQPGKHELKLRVEKSYDCYGFEPWSMHVSVFTAIDPSKLWCGSTYSLAPKLDSCSPGGRSQSGIITAPPTSTTSPTTTLPPSYVSVKQLSHQSNCVDKKNVRIIFSTQNLAGVSITVRQDDRQSKAKQFQNEQRTIDGRLCESEIWQLGKIDSDNREFKPIYPGKSLTINITDQQNQEDTFPGKLLPFVTTDIIINFKIQTILNIENGSAYFALGLVNVTKPADIGLRYYDHTIRDFSNVHVLTFTRDYQVMGWNIPNLGKTGDIDNTIHLHFQSEANVIMFDFLKLEYTKRDERKTNKKIARRGHWKVRGLRYATSLGMRVIVDDIYEAVNIEDAILMYQVNAFSRYQTVLRINADGTFYPYKPFRMRTDETQRTFVDVSGFAVHRSDNASNIGQSHAIRSMNLDSSSDVLTARYGDGSVLRLLLTATSTETKIQITDLETVVDQTKNTNAQSLVFTSTSANDYYTAVNTVSVKGRELNIMSKVDELSGNYSFTFKKTSPTNMFYANNFINIRFQK